MEVPPSMFVYHNTLQHHAEPGGLPVPLQWIMHPAYSNSLASNNLTISLIPRR